MRSRFPLLVETLVMTRKGTVGWTVALVAVACIYTAFFPQYRDNPELKNSMQLLPEWMVKTFNFSVLDGAGWLGSTVYGIVVPILTIVFAVTFAGRVLAADEERGVLDLYLTYPISRARVVVERFVAQLITLAGMIVVVGVVIEIFNIAFRMEVPVSHLVGMSLHLFAFGATFAALTLAASGLLTRRAPASAVAGGFAGFAFVIDALGKQFESAEPMRFVSPFRYYMGHEPLKNGAHLGDLVALTVVTATLLAVAIAAYQRRDLDG